MNQDNETLTELNYTLGRTAFEPGKSLSEQLREERMRIAKEMEVKRDSRTRIDMTKPDKSKRSGHYLNRSYYLDFNDPVALLESLEKEVIKVMRLPYPTIRMKVRYQEIVYAKKVFVFFAITYLNLTSFQVAHYLGMERSTLSHHLHTIMEVVDVYGKYQHIFGALDQWLYERADSTGYRRDKTPIYFRRGRLKA